MLAFHLVKPGKWCWHNIQVLVVKKMADRINSAGKINVGDYFESCSFHPCLCIEVDESGRNIEGISLIDGHIQNCSAVHCGIRKLTIDEAIEWKKSGPQEIEDQEVDNQWW